MGAFLKIGEVKVTACAYNEEPPFPCIRVVVAKGVKCDGAEVIAALDDSLEQPPQGVIDAIAAARDVIDQAARAGTNVVFVCRRGEVRSAAVACGVYKSYGGSQKRVEQFLRATSKMCDKSFSVGAVFAPVVRGTKISPRISRKKTFQ